MGLTSVIGSCGIVAKLGEENVKPLSVPASYGESSTDICSVQRSFSHRFKLSMPTNQSGLGTILTAKET